ncbi:TetR/AcrR family transcriptional regulator [Streptomyces lushanensis]|uniref:TetR/AcrR family transcriptional regulator n=1 Tax=Streptomyces lushanensis TaxID=1434255 RepID=UPI00083191C1|nr:TetR/AcrR family transcriptional regulator [Streptomyces lushanensis]
MDGAATKAPGRAMRADARRNYERILAAAEAEVAEHGVDASLEEIARKAQVGSATLHRHFPSRCSLLEAVFRGRVEALCDRAREPARDADPGTALMDWLRAVGEHAASARGLAASLVHAGRHSGRTGPENCLAMLTEAGDPLLRRAVEAGAISPAVSVKDLLTVVNGVSLATQEHSDSAAETDRLLLLLLTGGIRPRVHG